MKFDSQKIAEIIIEVSQQEVMPRWCNLQEGDILEKTGPKDLVTVADRAAEKALIEKLTKLYPETEFLGEEITEIEPQRIKLLDQDKPVWVIDPIDGTMAYSKGKPEFDIMLALVQKGEILGGWIYAPVDNDMYAAEKGAGIERHHAGIRSLKKRSKHLDEIDPQKGKLNLEALAGIVGKQLFTEEQHKQVLSKKNFFRKLMSTISAGHDYARIVRGEADFALYNKTKPWDHLPGLAFLQELGFHYARQDGSTYQPGHNMAGGLLIAPDQQSWNDIRQILLGAC